MLLLHRYALGEVARTVNILALADGNVVCQQLQGNAGNEGLEAFQSVGQGDDVVGKLLNLVVTLGNKSCDTSTTSTHLLNVTDDLFVETVACSNDEDGHL